MFGKMIIMDNLTKNIVQYTIACVHEFAKKHLLSPKEAFNYINRFKGLAFLLENYEAEHLLSINDAVDDLTQVCSNNGGGLK